MEIHYLYTILDPRTKLIFYVGRTINPRTRFNCHMTGTGKPSMIIRQIISVGLKPEFGIIDQGSALEISNKESETIKKLSEEGHKLVNHFHNEKHRQLNYDITIGDNVIDYSIKDLTITNKP